MLAPPSPAWVEVFASGAAVISDAPSDLPIEVHHIGSTAIPGLLAKPVIDMLGVVPAIKELFAPGSPEISRTALKQDLAGRAASDLVYSEGKTDFIRAVERRAAQWRRERA